MEIPVDGTANIGEIQRGQPVLSGNDAKGGSDDVGHNPQQPLLQIALGQPPGGDDTQDGGYGIQPGLGVAGGPQHLDQEHGACHEEQSTDDLYLPGDFLKILRKTKDGMRSSSIVDENQLELAVAFAELKFELMTVKKGGMKSGFLQADQVVSQKVADELKKQIPKLYTDPKTNVVFVNNGIKFQEANATTQELQLNENKSSNAEEICKLFGIPASMICGSRTGNSMTEEDEKQFSRACVAVMTDIECSLNRDLLLESEKKTYSWKFDTKELTRGSIGERYEAYKIGLEKNFLQIDEVREKEDMEPLGIDWVQMNLNTVFYNPKTKEIYTPNTNASMNLESGQGAVVKPEAEPEQKGGEPENEGGTES